MDEKGTPYELLESLRLRWLLKALEAGLLQRQEKKNSRRPRVLMIYCFSRRWIIFHLDEKYFDTW